MTDKPRTSSSQLLEAIEIGYRQGLHYVYGGNLPGMIGKYENTYCHHCQALLIERQGYLISSYRITAQGTCPDCGMEIPGVWTDEPEEIKSSRTGFPRFL